MAGSPDQETITNIATNPEEFKRVKNAKKQFTGFICLGTGAFLGFISCVLTLTNPIPELFNIILFCFRITGISPAFSPQLQYL
jgi:hypothetical protein